jgi:hypothetical protein
MEIFMSDIDKAVVLAALYNRAKPRGMGIFCYDPNPMTVLEAKEILATGKTYFDYIKGRPIKISFLTKSLHFTLYDRDNGPGAGEDAVIDALTSPK